MRVMMRLLGEQAETSSQAVVPTQTAATSDDIERPSMDVDEQAEDGGTGDPVPEDNSQNANKEDDAEVVRVSSRIKKLEAAGKIKSFAVKDLFKNQSKDTETSRRTQGNRTFFYSSFRPVSTHVTVRPGHPKVIPFQAVKKGVYIQQVEVKAIKVSQSRPLIILPR